MLLYTLNINGRDVVAREDKPLLSFLRDDLRITSAKDGCSEGACGTCTVLVDGKTVKACVQKVSRFTGKKILTVEGLGEREKAVYEHCFGEAGAVQLRLLHPRHGDLRQGPAGYDPRSDPGRREKGDPGQYLPLHRL